LVDPGVDGKVIIKATRNPCGCGLDPSGPKQGLVVGCCEQGNELSPSLR